MVRKRFKSRFPPIGRRQGGPAKPQKAAAPLNVGEKAAAARLEERAKLLSLRARSSTSTADHRDHEPPKAASLGPLGRLETLSFPLLYGIWRNAIRVSLLTAPADRLAGLKALAAIETEWRHRRFWPLAERMEFRWPSTDASAGAGTFTMASALSEGMLAYLEYRVGRVRGEPPEVRKAILDRVFGGFLPPVFPDEYLDGWNAPSSSLRLQKLAETLAAFIRNAKRNDSAKFADAVRDWEADLSYLFQTHYLPNFRFGWPTALIG